MTRKDILYRANTRMCLTLLLSSMLLLSSCYYQPDLAHQTIGSFAGGIGSGVVMAELGGDLISVGAAGILGSIFGGMIGQEQDNLSPLMQEDPMTVPVPLIYYQTIRAPLLTQQFHPGRILYNS